MGVFLVSSMPWVQLFQGGRMTGWASAVQIDWCPHGSGRFVALRRDEAWRVVGTDPDLFEWLAGWYLRPVMREAGYGWRQEPFERGEVELTIDLDWGMRASGGGIEIELREPINRRLIRRERYPLGDFAPTASWVRVSCAQARVTVDGQRLPGQPERGVDSYGPRTSAQVNVAEVWTT